MSRMISTAAGRVAFGMLLLGLAFTSPMLAGTSRDDLATKVYNIDSILADEDNGSQLTEIILQLVDPVSWDVLGGAGTIECRERKLVVHQTRCNHAKVRALLQALGKCPVHSSREDRVNGSIHIGTVDSQDQGRMDIVVYPVRDILQLRSTSPDRLMEIIANRTTPPNDWERVGGESWQCFFAYRPAIIVTTFPDTQKEVCAVLQSLREPGKQGSKKSPLESERR